MKKIIITLLSAAVLLSVFGNNIFAQQKDKDDVDNSSWNGRPAGTWDAVVKDGIVNIQFYGRYWSEGRDFNAAELGALPMDKVGEFSLTREAGKVSFKGVFQDHFGHGTYTFEHNTAFKSWVQQKGYKADDDLMRAVFFTDINKAYFDFMKENGYVDISDDQFKDLAEQNMSRKVLEGYFGMFKAEGYGRQSLEKIVELREHGVGPKYIASIHQMGYKNFSLDQALELRDHGVTADYIATIRKMGYPNLTLDEAQSLRDRGVTPEYVKNLQDMGYQGVTLDRAGELRDHGVTPSYISSIKQLGYKKISLEQAQELRDHGVTPGFIKSIGDLGFKDLSLEKAQELRDHGVTAAFIKKFRDKGVKKSLDEYIRLRDVGFEND
ncbi:MAG: hypothetical protein JST19_02270 [Bacteroidetes bacterium]|nr:hypothetical protein [Bacteroidota bacterium]